MIAIVLVGGQILIVTARILATNCCKSYKRQSFVCLKIRVGFLGVAGLIPILTKYSLKVESSISTILCRSNTAGTVVLISGVGQSLSVFLMTRSIYLLSKRA